LRDARLKRLAFYECSIAGTVFADRSNIESALFLSASTVEADWIGEALAMDGIRLNNCGSG
jgi:hypothetical protein